MPAIKKSWCQFFSESNLKLICALAAAALLGGIGSQFIIRAINSTEKTACAPVGIELPPGKVEGTGANKGY